jgi:hypothetical protein
LRAENDARVARVHVNRMRGWMSGAEENARKPEAPALQMPGALATVSRLVYEHKVGKIRS